MVSAMVLAGAIKRDDERTSMGESIARKSMSAGLHILYYFF